MATDPQRKQARGKRPAQAAAAKSSSGRARRGPRKRSIAAIRLGKRRAEVARLYLEGYTQYEIAEQVGVSQATVSADLAAAEVAWDAKATQLRVRGKLQALMKCDEAERVAWREFHRSCADEVRKEVGSTPNGPTERIVTRSQSGSPALLARIESLIELRCRLLGIPLEAADGAGGEDEALDAQKSDAEITAEIEAHLARIASQRAIELARAVAARGESLGPGPDAAAGDVPGAPG